MFLRVDATIALTGLSLLRQNFRLATPVVQNHSHDALSRTLHHLYRRCLSAMLTGVQHVSLWSAYTWHDWSEQY